VCRVSEKGILCFGLIPNQLAELWGCRHVEHMELMVLQRCLKWPNACWDLAAAVERAVRWTGGVFESYISRSSPLGTQLPVLCAAAGLAAPFQAACSRPSKRRVVAAAIPSEPGSWGEQLRPDTCNLDDQDRPGPLSDLDQEWQVGR
jgi:hypothetical protein